MSLYMNNTFNILHWGERSHPLSPGSACTPVNALSSFASGQSKRPNKQTDTLQISSQLSPARNSARLKKYSQRRLSTESRSSVSFFSFCIPRLFFFFLSLFDSVLSNLFPSPFTIYVLMLNMNATHPYLTIFSHINRFYIRYLGRLIIL